MDLISFYDKALSDVATSPIGRNMLLSLLAHLNTEIVDEHRFDDGADYVQECGLNDKQCEAVAYGVHHVI
ncbi:hypothetical protein C0W96_01190 [Photobacterium kishitanii]|uniref:hypothetical protein n=1 Tax=Photobacterium kishitanii TaxID=318456 RepID=UPI0005D37F27|nr:hypothetical protein [Photobacterium kishitanii]KJG09545.1 hypothetical protein UB40_12590 [Photobacterium kishitanii]PSV07897.1 hypothetical protein C0W96_01190 [Photobacterium kishitanii]PSV72875.1 hypothetical protein C0W29_19350 [Photobacterium kishitanii]